MIGELIFRYALGGRRRGFTRFVARASMLGMVLGVASLILVLSVMNGFSSELHRRILSLTPHLQLTQPPGGPLSWEIVGAHVEGMSEVRTVVPFVSDTLLLTYGTQETGVRVAGYDSEGMRDLLTLEDHLQAGSLEALSVTPFGIVLGSGVAARLGVRVGDMLTAILPSLSVTPAGVFTRQRELVVVAEFEVGSSIDAQQAYVSADTARRLFARGGIDGLQVALHDRDQSEVTASSLSDRFDGALTISTWQESQGTLFAAIRMEKITVAILLLAVIAVAAFNIVSTLTMAVTEKAADIAVLRVMGMSRPALLSIFLGYGLLLGGIGIAAGAGVGVLLATNISEIALALEQLSGSRLFDPSIYYIGRLPSELQWLDVIFTIVVALLLTLAATVYPALRAASIRPIEVLQDV